MDRANRQIGAQAGGGWRPAHVAALVLGNAALALGPWWVRLADSGPVSAGFWRLALALPLLALLAEWNGQKLFALPRTAMWAMLAAGTFFGLDLASWHLGIEATRLGNAVLFGNSGSLIVMAWGLMALHRLPHRAEWLAFAAAIAGAAILMGRSLELDAASLVGDLLCLLAGLFYAVYIVLLQKARAELGSWSLLFWSSLAGAPVLLTTALVLGEPVWPHDWTPLAIGLALLTQPAIAVAAGWFAFNERLALADLLGMALVAAALLLARSAERAPVKPRSTP